MKILVTGSSGHLGEALVRTLQKNGHDVLGLDVIKTEFTNHVGSVCDRSLVQRCMDGVQVVFHVATLHKPHVATHSKQNFVDTNITGTLTLLEEATVAGVDAFVFTSTTSVFGDALIPPTGSPAAWITEEVTPRPKNIYGVTKAAAEDLCQLFQRNHGLPCLVLRTSRFFPEEDDDREVREVYADANLKLNEFLSRRVEIEDVVSAHLLAAQKARSIGFRRYIISATTPFALDEMTELRNAAPRALKRHSPSYEAEYARRGWKMSPGIDRVYINELARRELGWQPRYDFRLLLEKLKAGEELQSPLARTIGAKGYHAGLFTDGPYPIAVDPKRSK